MRPDAMRPRSWTRPERVRPGPNDLASRPHRLRGLNISVKTRFFVTCRQLVYFEILLLPNSTTRSGVARNVNWGASPALPVPPPPFNGGSGV